MMMLSRTLALAIAYVLMSPATARAQLQLDEGFEGTLSDWTASGNNTAAIVSSPVRAGKGAVHLHLGPSDPDPKRTEITAGTKGQLQYDQEYWIGFSFNVTGWGAPAPSWATLFQFHAVPGNSNWSCCAGRNPFTVTDSAGKLGVAVITSAFSGSCGAIADTVWTGTPQMSKWYDWVVRLKPSLTATGILEVWLDGTKLYSKTGPNVDTVDVCGVAQEPWTYLKIGIYKEYTNTATEDVYFDEVRIYKGTGGYNIVVPGGALPVDGGVPDAKPPDAKVVDAKPKPDAKVVDAKPKPADAKPSDAKVSDAKPADARLTDGLPVDSAARDAGDGAKDAPGHTDGRGPEALIGGCGCEVAGAGSGGWRMVVLLLVVWLVAWRRGRSHT